jgi:hypothetical protein
MHNHDFDAHFNRVRKYAIAIGVLAIVLKLSILGGVAWVVYKLLSHNGVI